MPSRIDERTKLPLRALSVIGEFVGAELHPTLSPSTTITHFTHFVADSDISSAILDF